MFSFPKVSKGQPFQDYSKAIKWRYDENEFIAWKEGKTGFPIVDAAMRQLIHEVGCIIVKNGCSNVFHKKYAA